MFLKECAKLAGSRSLRVSLAVFMLLNLLAALPSVSGWDGEEEILCGAVLDEFRADPEGTLARYTETMSRYEELRRNLLESAAGKRRNSFSALAEYEERISADAEYRALGRLAEQVERAAAFPEAVRKIIRQAEVNLRLYDEGRPEKSAFGRLYQERVIRQYQAVLNNTKIGVDDLRGWEAYFGNRSAGAAAVFAAVLSAGIAVGMDHESGAAVFLCSTKYGRRRRKAARMLALGALTICFALAAEAEVFGLVSLTYGFGWGGSAVQALPVFETCPYVLTLAEAAAIRLLFRALFALLLGSLTLLLADLLQSGIAGAAVGMLCAGASTVLAYSGLPVGSSLLLMTEAAFRAPFPYFVRFLALNLFGTPADGLCCAVAAFATLAAGFSAADLLLFRRAAGLSLPRRIKGKTLILRKRLHVLHADGLRGGSVLLLSHEVYKALIASRALGVIFVLLAVYGIGMMSDLNSGSTYTDEVYDRCIGSIRGEWSEEKEALILEKTETARELVSGVEAIREEYLSGRISRDVYGDYMKRANAAYLELPALEELTDYLAYLRRRVAQGRSVSIVNDTVWLQALQRGLDWTEIVSVSLLSLASFGEYTKHDRNNLTPIRSCTRAGRKKTLRVKTAAGVLLCSLLFFVRKAAWLLCSVTPLPHADLSVPLLSLRVTDGTVAPFMDGISLRGGFFLGGAIQYLCILTLYLWTAYVLYRFKNKYAAVAASIPAIVLCVICA